MNRKEAKELLPIIKAFAEGKTIQLQHIDCTWQDAKYLNLGRGLIYRIQPEQKYRPFKNAEECWTEMQKHKPFGWIYDGSYYYSIVSISNETINIVNDTRDIVDFLFSEIFEEDYTFADGTPFGVKVEE